MAFKDPNDKKRYDREYQANHTKNYVAQIRVDSGIPVAIDKAVEDSGLSKNQYLIAALREKLIRDGYLSPEPVTPKE